MKQRLIFPLLGLGALALGTILLLVLRMLATPPAQALPTLSALPQFALTDQTGAPFTRESLAGKAWVADFIFTHCSGTCPRLTAQMHKLAQRTDPSLPVRFVSFSVDPENDTPEVLAEYARKIPADGRWTFVTGDADAVKDTVVKGFKMTAQRVEKGAGEYDVVHGNWFVLGDASGRVRGYYHVETPEELDALAEDLARVARAKDSS
jgi:protein SCO1/2